MATPETSAGIHILERNIDDERKPKVIWDEIFHRFYQANPNQKFAFVPHSFEVIQNPGHTKRRKILTSILAIPK